jgi:hypothetical protein
MKCPHCLTDYHQQVWLTKVGSDENGEWAVEFQICPGPKCERAIIKLYHADSFYVDQHGVVAPPGKPDVVRLVHPKGYSRAPLSPDVPARFAAVYKEACSVLADSPKASAALSRHCLQDLLRETGGVEPGDLVDEIKEVLDKKTLSAALAGSLDAIRTVGNFAAHPIKSKSTGNIVDVELGEAEWNLDTLEGLFDHYFIQPAIIDRKRAALNKKLADAGKKPLK